MGTNMAHNVHKNKLVPPGQSYKLPTLLVSSVHRSSKQSQAHGGVYLVNLNTGKYKNLFLAKHDVSLHGRGGERGFRGIAFWKGKTYLGLHDGVQIYNQKFKHIDTIRQDNYLGSVHEICIFQGTLYVVSTNYDSIIAFNLQNNKMINCMTIKHKNKNQFFLCKKNNPPIKADSLHINNVYADNRGVFCSGTNFSSLLQIKNNVLKVFSRVLPGTHNCRPYMNDKIICNDTQRGRLAILSIGGRCDKYVNVRRIGHNQMVGADRSEKIARQPFARGLTFDDRVIIGGSSPDMISVYNKNDLSHIKTINLSMNITHCIHGLEIYPYQQDVV